MDEKNQIVVKVFSRVLSADVEYKALSITKTTTAEEVIRMLLSKFRQKHRDPNLFFLTIEVWIRKTGIPLRSVMVLDDKACPAQLQAVYPHQGTKFTLQMKRGGLVKVYDSCLSSGTQYKSLLLSDRTTVEELIQLVLHCNHSLESPQNFCLYEVSPARSYERRLHKEDLPLRIQQEWPTEDLVFFQLKRNTSDEELPLRRSFPWTRVIDETGNITFRYNFNRSLLESDQVSTSGSSDSLSTVKTSSTASSQSSSCNTSTSSSEYDKFYI